MYQDLGTLGPEVAFGFRNWKIDDMERGDLLLKLRTLTQEAAAIDREKRQKEGND